MLAWVELMSWVAHHLVLEAERRDAYLNERKNQDLIFGLLLLKTDFWELKCLDFLPFILEKLQLDASWMALLYALGYEDHLRSEGVIPEEQDHVAARDLFLKWFTQPVAKDLPSKPELMQGMKIKLHSIILGCKLEVESANNLTSIFLSETILGVLEAFLATGMGEKVVSHCSDFHLIVKPSEFVDGLPEYRFHQKMVEADVEISHSEKLDYQTIEGRNAFRSWLIQLVAEIIARIFFIHDPKGYLTRLARDEAGFGRALNNSDISTAVTNILGPSPKLRLSDWKSEDIQERFPVNRQAPWNEGVEEVVNDKKTVSIYERIGEGPVPKELFDFERLKHRDLQVYSLINLPLWDKARWKATVYVEFPDSNQPPFMALGFADAEAGKTIFDEWHKRIGKIDSFERLRVSIITGVNKNRPFSYSVVIGANPKLKSDTQSSFLILVSRINRMDPPNQINLNRFLDMYKKMGWYVLLPIHFANGSAASEPLWEYGIAKRELTIRPAWQIAEHDPDAVAIQDNDEPIIPDGVNDPPVLRVLKRKTKVVGH